MNVVAHEPTTQNQIPLAHGVRIPDHPFPLKTVPGATPAQPQAMADIRSTSSAKLRHLALHCGEASLDLVHRFWLKHRLIALRANPCGYSIP
jgi:hypothetical protein